MWGPLFSSKDRSNTQRYTTIPTIPFKNQGMYRSGQIGLESQGILLHKNTIYGGLTSAVGSQYFRMKWPTPVIKRIHTLDSNTEISVIGFILRCYPFIQTVSNMMYVYFSGYFSNLSNSSYPICDKKKLKLHSKQASPGRPFFSIHILL